jgi:hypothetical protein
MDVLVVGESINWLIAFLCTCLIECRQHMIALSFALLLVSWIYDWIHMYGWSNHDNQIITIPDSFFKLNLKGRLYY